MLINPEVRKLANGIRTVEDPIMAKAKAAKVRTTAFPYLFNHFFYDEDLSQILRDAEFDPVLGPTCTK